MAYEAAFARYDIWLTNAPEGHGDEGYIEGYPVKCSECGDRVYAKQGAEALCDQPHADCRDEDTGESIGFYRCESNYDWTWDDPRVP